MVRDAHSRCPGHARSDGFLPGRPLCHGPVSSLQPGLSPSSLPDVNMGPAHSVTDSSVQLEQGAQSS